MLKTDTIYIHYGSDKFDISKFENIENNIYSTKPVIGGLWASPKDSKNSWNETMIIKRPQDNKFFTFKISNEAKILMIEKKEDLEHLPRLIPDGTGNFNIILDFEKISRKYDVIYCDASKEEINSLLPNWDCECILVINPNVIKCI